MKKIISIFLCLGMMLMLCSCGLDSKKTDIGEYKIAMITDFGDINDRSFNQTTYEACKSFCDSYEIPFEYYKPEDDSASSREAKVRQAIADGYNLLVLPGFTFGEIICKVAPSYPDVKFFALDVSKGDILESAVGSNYDYNPDNWNIEDYINIDNVYCANFKEELSGFMAGYTVVSLGYTELGFLGGMQIPAIKRFGYGFIQGAETAAAQNDVNPTIKFAYGNQFYGDDDITAVMDSWYAEGTEVVFACGGSIYKSVAEAASKVGGKIIGVDVDQVATIDGMYGENMTVTSAMKGLYPATADTLEDIIIHNKWDNYKGKIVSLGLISGTDPEVNYCQIPMESTQFDSNYTKEDYKELVSQMYSGVIKVSDKITDMPITKYVKVDFQGDIK